MTAGARSALMATVLGAVLLALVLAAGCGDKEPAAVEKKGPLYLGVVAPMSGTLKPAGRSLVQGADLAVQKANAEGGVRGRPVRLLVEDEVEASNLPPERRLARDPRVSLILGHLMERTFEDSRALYLEAGLPVLLPVLSPEDITEAPQPLFFRLMPSDKDQTRALADYAVKKLKDRRILVVHDGSANGRDQAQVFSQAIGQSAETQALVFADAGQAFEAFKSQAQAFNPDMIFTTLSNQQAVALAQLLSGLDEKPALLGGCCLALVEVGGFLTRYLPRTFLALPYDPGVVSPPLRKFAEAYRQAHHRAVDWVAVAGYDAVKLALAALTEAGDDPKEVAAYLNRLSDPSRSFEGLAGAFHFKTNGRGVHPVFVVQLTPSLIRHLP